MKGLYSILGKKEKEEALSFSTNEKGWLVLNREGDVLGWFAKKVYADRFINSIPTDEEMEELLEYFGGE